MTQVKKDETVKEGMRRGGINLNKEYAIALRQYNTLELCNCIG